MTSLAFALGVVPLAIATGPSAASQNAIGTGVLGGMISATVLAIFFVPAFFVIVLKTLRTKRPSEEVDVKDALQGDEVPASEELSGTATAAAAHP
jgi:multidrug efflux pump